MAAVVAFVLAPAAAGGRPPIQVPYSWSGPEVAFHHDVLVLNQQAFPHDNRAQLLKIDPRTNRIVAGLSLPFGPASGPLGPNVHNLVIARGVAWLTLYNRSELIRVDLTRMRVTKRVAVGRAPSSVVLAAGDLWVALQYGRGLERVDPATGRLLGRVPVGRQGNTTDGPYQLAFDGKHLLATLPGTHRVAVIDPSSRRVTYDDVSPAMACSRVLPVPGGYWLDDTECSNAYYRWTSSQRRITAKVAPNSADYGAAVISGHLYTAEDDCDSTGCHAGHLVKRDIHTGRKIASKTYSEAWAPWYADDWIWFSDFDHALLLRTRPF